MAGSLGKKKRARLAKLIRQICESPCDRGEAPVMLWIASGKSLDLNIEGYYLMRDAVAVLHSVPAWKGAYPFDTLANRIAHCILEAASVDEAIAALLGALDADCKDLVAYAPIFGFNLVDGAVLKLGPYTLEVLGKDRIEAEIIDRLRQHTTQVDETVRSAYIERTRRSLVKHENVPMLRMQYFGSKDGAVDSVSPIADRIATFMQFAIGVISDRNTHIIDHRGRYTGEFTVTMPVMTVAYGELSFPNVRGMPHRINVSDKDVKRLEDYGVLWIAEYFLAPPWQPAKGIRALICRAIGCFADGERAVTDIAKIVSYVSAMDVFFGHRDRALESFCEGLAATLQGPNTPYRNLCDLAEAVYDERSRAAHDGVSPRLAFVARNMARDVILKMLEMRETLTTKKRIGAWAHAFAANV